MGRLILLRHGQSLWNKKNLFTGWVDVPLSKTGIEEALSAGTLIKQEKIDIVYTSTLIRAQMTAMLALSENESLPVPVFVHEDVRCSYEEGVEKSLPVYAAWQLNERHYGKLQGKNKDQARAEFGVEQVHRWRRSYDEPPPEGESLEMTAARTIPYFQQSILPALEEGKTLLVAAHGNSLRSIVMEIEGLSKEEVVQLEIPTGEPWFYKYDQKGFNRL